MKLFIQNNKRKRQSKRLPFFMYRLNECTAKSKHLKPKVALYKKIIKGTPFRDIYCIFAQKNSNKNILWHKKMFSRRL